MFNKINNEKGIALIAALMVLLVLTMLGISAILTSTTDMQIGNNEKNAIQGQYVAEAGIEHMMVFLNKTTNIEPTGANEAKWSTTANSVAQSWNKSLRRDIKDGANTFFSYSTTVSYKIVQGTGTSYDNRVSFYNHTAGFSNAPGSGGWPVYEIRSVAKHGNYQSQANILEVTKTSFPFNVQGAFTANGNIELSGNVKVDGNCYPETGASFGATTPCACKNPSLQDPMPDIYTSGEYDQDGTTADFGKDEINENQAAGPTTPWGAMGVKKNSSDTNPDISAEFQNGPYFDDIFPPASGWPKSVITTPYSGNNYYSTSTTSVNITGNGLLVIHNPLFTPADSCFAACGTCSGLCAPAQLDVNTGTFNGIIIADAVELTGNLTVNGALISLSTFTADNTVGAGTLSILYSCAAIEKFASGQINKKLNWRKE